MKFKSSPFSASVANVRRGVRNATRSKCGYELAFSSESASSLARFAVTGMARAYHEFTACRRSASLGQYVGSHPSILWSDDQPMSAHAQFSANGFRIDGKVRADIDRIEICIAGYVLVLAQLKELARYKCQRWRACGRTQRSAPCRWIDRNSYYRILQGKCTACHRPLLESTGQICNSLPWSISPRYFGKNRKRVELHRHSARYRKRRSRTGFGRDRTLRRAPRASCTWTSTGHIPIRPRESRSCLRSNYCSDLDCRRYRHSAPQAGHERSEKRCIR